MKWSDDQFDTLKGLVDQGLTSRQIGNELGLTRNAVIGKVRRNGLSFRNARGPVKPAPRKRAGRTRRYAAMEPSPAAKPPGLTELEPEITAAAVTLAELTDALCHWPVDGAGAAMMYCGGDVMAGQPYCRRHWRVAHGRGLA